MKNYTYYGSKNPNSTIIYIHGGAFIMGDRFDLPESLHHLLIKDHRALITLDYPLAPQVQYEDIITTVLDDLNSLIDRYAISNLILMGRSAGSNIIFSLDPRLLNAKVTALVSFYGYASVDTEWMSDEVSNISIPVNQSLINQINSDDTVVYQRDLKSTYPYYLSLRLLKQWSKTIGFKHKEILWPNNIPLFIAHSIYDPDVPYRCSFTLKNHFTSVTSYTSTSKKHAFDHDPLEQDKLFETLNSFLDNFK